MIAALLLACSSSEPPVAPSLRARCFGSLGPSAFIGDYEPLGPNVPEHCQGTDHQDIDAVSKVVFVGDSITAGTPPTPSEQVYRAILTRELTERFGPVDISNCSEWGASLNDLESQLEDCLAPAEPEPVLVIFTVGGNDMVSWGQDLADGVAFEEVEAESLAGIEMLEAALQQLRDPARFPAGAHVVFANVYEYTDGTNDVGVCPLADLFDVPSGISEFREGYVSMNEAYVDLAVRTGTDVVFLFEHFCGHGFYNEDPTNACYRGPDAPRYFDNTCIHPTPEGHERLAEMILAVIDE